MRMNSIPFKHEQSSWSINKAESFSR